MKRASCGLDINYPVEIRTTLKFASSFGFEFVSIPIVHPRYKREFIEKWKNRCGPFTRPDLVLTSTDWNSLIAGRISPYLNLDIECLTTQSKHALDQEIKYGNHLDLPAFIIQLKSLNCDNLARTINSHLSGLKPYQIWVELPLISFESQASVWRSDENDVKHENTWEWWNKFRILCNSDRRLGVVLEISKELPKQKELDRWMGEPIKCILLSTSLFLTNKKGFPVLSKAQQVFIKSLVPLDVQVIIKGNNHHYSLDCYQKYINYLWQEATVQQNSKSDEMSEEIQSLPVSNMYKLLKADPIKYGQYIKAVKLALLDKIPDEEKETKVLNVMVVSAGKGTLILTALEAAAATDRKIKVYAVESNHLVSVTLQVYQEEFWEDKVEIITGDIRNLKFPKIIDIVLSELIGSFGDNELSPEVLDCAQKYLRDGGVSIPQSYTSYLNPVQCSKVYSDLKANKEKSDCEVPYTISLTNVYSISQPKKLFTFHHPNFSDEIDNSRYKKLNFQIEQNCVLHGFTGYFSVALYKDIILSIVPEFQTPGLFTWYPILFPLTEPVQLKENDNLEVVFWRLVGSRSIWYEWTITKPVPLPIHNVNGRFSSIEFTTA